MKARTWVGLVVMVLGGCATITSPDEYALYRTFQYEQNPDRRTAIGTEYTRRYPEGRFHDKVATEVAHREDEFWDERRSTLEGLQAYLLTFPSGNHSAEARARIQ